MASNKIYEMVTERIVNALNDAIRKAEQGETVIAPWNRPWFESGMPSNLISKKPYRGCNAFLLSIMGFSSPYFLTFNQAKKLGGEVKKGEKSIPVIFWKWLVVNEDENGVKLPKPKNIPMLRYYNVFNVSQVNGIEDHIPKQDKREFNPIQDAEKIVRNMPNRPNIITGGKASYVPSKDIVNMPEAESFKENTGYYATLFHELIHSTGHTSRLNRPEVMDYIKFGSHNYSCEELVAEMGAVFLCNEIGIQSTFENSISYLKSWLGKLKDDVKMVISAGGKAQKAVDYILDIKYEPVTDNE